MSRKNSMKTVILFLITVLICSPSCKTIHKDEDSFLTKTKFKVISIKNDKSIFIIEAIRNDSIFKILSDKGLEKTKNVII